MKINEIQRFEKYIFNTQGISNFSMKKHYYKLQYIKNTIYIK